MKAYQKIKNKSGIGLVEIIIASSIISITILVLLTVYTMVSKHSNYNIYTLKGSQIAEETIEVLKFLRDSGWNSNIETLSTNTTYHPYWNINLVPNRWTAVTSNILLENKYEVSFVLSDVYRDGSHNVVSSGGTLDNGSRKVNINVSWRQNGATSTKSMETYLFNIFNN